MTISERLGLLLSLKGLEVLEVARLANMDRQAIWKILRGETVNPGVVTVERIVSSMNSTMAEFYGLEQAKDGASQRAELTMEIIRVLLSVKDDKGAPIYVTTLQILNRLSPALRNSLIERRGGVCAGSGALYSPTKDVANAIKKLGDIVVSDNLAADDLSFLVANKRCKPGYPVIAVHKIKAILVKNLKPGLMNWFVGTDALRIDEHGDFWLCGTSPVADAFTDATPILIMRGSDGFVANQPDRHGWRMEVAALVDRSRLHQARRAWKVYTPAPVNDQNSIEGVADSVIVHGDHSWGISRLKRKCAARLSVLPACFQAKPRRVSRLLSMFRDTVLN